MNRVKFLFAWYDFWVGGFYDRKKKDLYFLPIPMIGIVIDCASYYEIVGPNGKSSGFCTNKYGNPKDDVDRGMTLRPIKKREWLNKIK